MESEHPDNLASGSSTPGRSHSDGRHPGFCLVSLTLMLMSAPLLLAGPARADDARAEILDPSQVRAAILRALPLLETASAEEYQKHRDCFSCHNQGVPALTLNLLKRRGFAINAEVLRDIDELTANDLRSGLREYNEGKGQPGGVIRAGYALWTLDATGHPPDDVTKAVTHYLTVADRGKGYWRGSSDRPPSEKSDFTATFLAIRAIRDAEIRPANSGGGPGADAKGAGDASRKRLADALDWLRKATPRDTEDRVFRLWSMKLAEARPEEIHAARTEILRTQRDDGGWSQLTEAAKAAEDQGGQKTTTRPDAKAAAENSETTAGYESDAYATGSALVVLQRVGELSTDSPAYQRGLSFLLRTQRGDGSWLVRSRSRPFQPYFESGFPYGKDQFISIAATAWAVQALALDCPKSP